MGLWATVVGPRPPEYHPSTAEFRAQVMSFEVLRELKNETAVKAAGKYRQSECHAGHIRRAQHAQ